MLTINSNFQQLLEKENIFSFINTSIQQISYNIPDLFQRKEYWLFYYIKDDFWANCASLYRMDIEQDFLGFPLIRKNTRHAIEAFFDFYNLCYDPDYMCVLEQCAGERKDGGKYSKYLYHGRYTIRVKSEIAKIEHGGEFEKYLDIYRQCNAYVHPNVFLDVISVTDIRKKEEILKKFLLTNLELLDISYRLFLYRFNQNMQPLLFACHNRAPYCDCNYCYKKLFNDFQCIVNDPVNPLLTLVNPAPINFQY